jgi:hypothetical protein
MTDSTKPVLRVVVYLTYDDSDPSDEPIRDIYGTYDVERDIERILLRDAGRGMTYLPANVEAVDAEWIEGEEADERRTAIRERAWELWHESRTGREARL